jgi:O-acetyl-ADP-ribose deacetylase (regulator of RNase III)
MSILYPTLIFREPEFKIRKALEDACPYPTSRTRILPGEATSEESCSAIVIPTTIQGFLDRGLALAASVRFDWGCQRRLQAQAIGSTSGKLDPWAARIVKTMDPRVPYLICVPVGTSDLPVFSALRGALRCQFSHNLFLSGDEQLITSIALSPSSFNVLGQDPKYVVQQVENALADYMSIAENTAHGD